MANTLANLARMTCDTTGTGDLHLVAAVAGFLTFAQAGVANGATVSYAIEEGENREVGYGVYTAASQTLTRAVYSSTNGNAKISLTGGAQVAITALKEDFDTFLTASAADALFLTPAEGDAAYQPLDATLTALAAANWSANALPIGTGADTLSQTSFAANTFPARASTGNLVAKTITDFGLSLVDDADASAARSTLGLVIGTNVQAYDAELAAIAGLASAADKVPYFTGSAAASLADFTGVARTLVAQTTQANMRSTGLGLGTAATQNTGTSGTNVPLLDGANTWSGVQVIQTTGAGSTPLQVINTDAGATGPSVLIDHFSASPAAFDTVAQLTFSGRDAGGNQTNYAQFAGVILDTTDGSEDGRFVVRTVVAGTLAARLFVEQGAYMSGATGTDKGVGTFNATAVYDDNVLLTCPGVEFIKTGKVSTDTWDAFAPDLDVPDEIVGGTRVKGKRVKRKHRVAHEMKALLDEGFDPRNPKQYFKKLLDDEALPGMPTKANWQHGSHSVGEINSKLWLAVELLTATVKTMHEEIEVLKGRLS